MRRLKVDIEDIGMVMEEHDRMHDCYLDTESGEVVMIPPELKDDDILDDAFVADLPGWEQELVPAARAILEDDDRYAPIPQIESDEVYDLMVEFAEAVADDRLRRRLLGALDGRGAFGRFKRVLGEYPVEEEAWFRMKDEFVAQRVREWLAEELEIEPAEEGEG